MTTFSLKLSAYLDGELDPKEAAEVEARLSSDPTAQAELDALMQADALARDQFDAQLDDPVSLDLAQQINSAALEAHTEEQVPPAPRRFWPALAASLVIFALGGVGGYLIKDQRAPQMTASNWLTDIADYHAIYASQGRHLVEVAADDADHIEAWLGKTIMVEFSIPDLTAFDLTFEGGRLLVANGKPVAQLMYRQPDGVVVALCLQRSNAPAVTPPQFNTQNINGFDLVSWKAGHSAYVIVGPGGQPNLGEIAATAAVDI